MTRVTAPAAGETFIEVAPGGAVSAAPGDVVSVRMATPGQCRAFGLPLWSARLLWSVAHPDGTTTFCPADDVLVAGAETAADAAGAIAAEPRDPRRRQ